MLWGVGEEQANKTGQDIEYEVEAKSVRRCVGSRGKELSLREDCESERGLGGCVAVGESSLFLPWLFA